jgi:hypothetical protein
MEKTIEKKYAPPRIVRILSVVQILFSQPDQKHFSICKVDITKLNKKMQKLQEEGNKVLGIFVTDVDREPQVATQQGGEPHVSGHDEGRDGVE